MIDWQSKGIDLSRFSGRTCGWRKVRVGLGPNWSNWIF